MALALEFLQNIVHVHWGEEGPQQGLVAEYPLRSDPGPGQSLFGEPTATALDSGESFTGVHMGASGLGHTVLSKGLVCFGKPRDGDACFMVAADWDVTFNLERPATIERGTIEDGEIRWEGVGGGKGLAALSFAGEAFHAVYVEEQGSGPTRIETSFDGEHWESAAAFPAGDRGATGGTVAYNGESYAATGRVTIETPDTEPRYTLATVENLQWVTASPPPGGGGSEKPGTSLSWSYGKNNDVDGDPGAAHDFTDLNSCMTAGGFVGGGDEAKGVFIAAAWSKQKLVQELPSGISSVTFLLSTAAAAVSTDGSSWSTETLSGAQPPYHTFSNEGDTAGGSSGTAVCYVREKAKEGHFLASAGNFTQTKDKTTIWATVHKSPDGYGWSQIRRTDNNICFGISAIAKELGKTEIVYK